MESEILVNGEAVSPEAASFLGALAGTTLIVVLAVSFVWAIIQIVACWKIFTKAGKPGWHSIIPYLSTWDEIDLAWNGKMAWVYIGLTIFVSLFSPIFNRYTSVGKDIPTALLILVCILIGALVVISVMALHKMSKAFGKGIGFTLGLIFLNPIFMIILGFGDAKYLGRQG